MWLLVPNWSKLFTKKQVPLYFFIVNAILKSKQKMKKKRQEKRESGWYLKPNHLWKIGSKGALMGEDFLTSTLPSNPKKGNT